MITILQQICENFIREVAGFFSQDKVLLLEEMETTLKEKTDAFILEMMQAYLEQLDQEIVDDKAGRKKKGLWLNVEMTNEHSIHCLGNCLSIGLISTTSTIKSINIF